MSDIDTPEAPETSPAQPGAGGILGGFIQNVGNLFKGPTQDLGSPIDASILGKGAITTGSGLVGDKTNPEAASLRSAFKPTEGYAVTDAAPLLPTYAAPKPVGGKPGHGKTW